MGVQYDLSHDPNTFYTVGESLTEQEHKDSCDINKMIKKIARGENIMGAEVAPYGYDDMNIDGITHRNNKAALERELRRAERELEFSEEELKLMPESVTRKYKLKKKQPVAAEPPVAVEPPTPAVKEKEKPLTGSS